MAEAALEARDGVPAVLADAFVPPALAGLAQAVVSDWNSGARVLEYGAPAPARADLHLERAAALVRAGRPAERELVLEPRRRVLRYRTEISKARRRAHRALSVLRRSVGDVPISEAVEESARWLEEFHPRSVVELDYGGLAAVLPDETLSADDSPALVGAGLAALAKGDADAATGAYEQLVERWRAIQLLERCN